LLIEITCSTIFPVPNFANDAIMLYNSLIR